MVKRMLGSLGGTTAIPYEEKTLLTSDGLNSCVILVGRSLILFGPKLLL